MNGPQIKAMRDRLGWGQKRLCRMLGVSLRTLKYWESNAHPPDSSAIRLMKLLDRSSFTCDGHNRFEQLVISTVEPVSETEMKATMPRKNYDHQACFRGNLRLALKQKGMTLEELAKKVGLHRTSMSRIINGHQAMTVERAAQIAKAVDLELWEIWRKPKKTA